MATSKVRWTFQMKVPPAFRVITEKCARRENTSMAAFVRNALMRYMENYHQDLAYEAEGLLEPQEGDEDDDFD